MPHLRARLRGAASADARTVAALSLLVQRHQSRTGQNTDGIIQGLSRDGVYCPPGDPLSALVSDLTDRGFISFHACDKTFTMHPLPGHFPLAIEQISTARPLRLAKFTAFAAEGGRIVVRNPLSDRWLELNNPQVVAWLAQFAQPLAYADTAEDMQSLVAVLALGQLLLPCDAEGLTLDETDPVRRMWEPHDLLFHSRSRRGRSDRPVGNTHEFLADRDVEEMRLGWAPVREWRVLPEPTIPRDPGLFETMLSRRSIRTFSRDPVPLGQLSALLQLALGRRPDGNPYYPSGGAIYELTFYVAVAGTSELPSGLYRYDVACDRLGLMETEISGVARLLDDAAHAMGVTTPPPMLLIIAGRYPALRRKYGGLSYSLQLKHVGVVQEALYLTASAIGLAGCALGVGDSDRFARVTGLDYLKESSVGEFAFGMPVLDPKRDS